MLKSTKNSLGPPGSKETECTVRSKILSRAKKRLAIKKRPMTEFGDFRQSSVTVHVFVSATNLMRLLRY
jgi:hypothetical protein